MLLQLRENGRIMDDKAKDNQKNAAESAEWHPDKWKAQYGTATSHPVSLPKERRFGPEVYPAPRNGVKTNQKT